MGQEWSLDRRLAQSDVVNLEDLAALEVIDTVGAFPVEYLDVFNPFHTPRGRTITRGPVTAGPEQAFSAPRTARSPNRSAGTRPRYYQRPDLTYRPFSRDWTISWGPIWKIENDNAGVRGLTAAMTGLGPRQL